MYLPEYKIGLELTQHAWLLLSHSVMFDSLWPHGLQHDRLPCPLSSPRACTNSCPLSRWHHSTTSLSLLSPSPPFNLSQHQGLFQWVSSLHQVAKVLALQPQPLQWTLRIDSLKEFMVLSPCSPRDSQESSPTPQFKSINSSALSFLHSPTLTSIHN